MGTGVFPYFPLPIPVTALYGSLYARLLLALALLVVRQRLGTRTEFGDGNHAALRRAIRVHANAVEYLPISLMMLALCELAGMSHLALHGWAGGLLIARIGHAFGLSRTEGTNPFRAGGALFQFAFLLALPLWLLAHLGGLT